jgi:purine-binding chemotaxis protein CheW
MPDSVTAAPLTWFDDDDVVLDETSHVDHVVVRLGSGRYGVCAPDVAEVIPLPRLTRVPNTSAWLCGVGNWRGHVLPVVDLRPLLGLPMTPLPSSARVVVVSVDDVEVGIIAEAVAGLIEVPESCDAPPVTLTGTAADLVVGLADGGVGGPVAVLATSGLLGLRGRAAGSRA